MHASGVNYSGPLIGDGDFRRIELDDDSRGKASGYYKLFLDDIPNGLFGAWKVTGPTPIKWSPREGHKALTLEERREIRERARQERERKAREKAERQAVAEALSRRLWQAAQPATAEHAYLKRKGVGPGPARVGDFVKIAKDGREFVAAKGALLVPMCEGKATNVIALQAIYASPVLVNGETRDKDFVFGARKDGLYCPIGGASPVIDGRKTVLICEGYATGLSIHEATGLSILVAFDAGNLLPVARYVRGQMPKARIIICADNDQFTTRADGSPWNPGVEKAQAAAEAVDGEVITPWFTGDIRKTKPTDFNDLHERAGLAEVKRQIDAAVTPAPVSPDGAIDFSNGVVEGSENVHPFPEEPPPPDSAEPEGDAPLKKRKKKGRTAPPDGVIEAVDAASWFTILGHDRERIHVYQRRKRVIISHALGGWGAPVLITLASLDFWQAAFPGSESSTNGFDLKSAQNWFERAAEVAGFYDPKRLRGRGAWRDSGRVVLHLGDRLVVDGETVSLADFDSDYVYEQGEQLTPPADEMASKEDGLLIIETAKTFHWTRPASAALLVGWLVLGPVCGALRWRPHAWLTGGAGSGKSTLLNEFAKPLLNGWELFAQGNSTEAGIRQELRTDARPVIFDEAEQNNETERRRIQGVLALIRQASTESSAKTLKGTQFGNSMGFMIRSMFLLSSIQVGLEMNADIERMSVLSLRPKSDSIDPASSWDAIQKQLAKFSADPELPARVLRRTIDLLPVIAQSVDVFARAGAEKLGSQRDGDQYGALMAGAWSLISTEVATLDDARRMFDRYDWQEYTEDAEEESSAALQTVLLSTVRLGGGRSDVMVRDLVARAAGYESAFRGEAEEAQNELRKLGMRVKPDKVLFRNKPTPSMASLLEKTPYRADLKGQLMRLPGASSSEQGRFLGPNERAVAVPLSLVFDGEAPLVDEIDFS